MSISGSYCILCKWHADLSFFSLILDSHYFLMLCLHSSHLSHFFTCYLCFRCSQPIIKNRNGIVYEIKDIFSCLRIKPFLLSDEFVLWGKKYVSNVILPITVFMFLCIWGQKYSPTCNLFVISVIECLQNDLSNCSEISHVHMVSIQLLNQLITYYSLCVSHQSYPWLIAGTPRTSGTSGFPRTKGTPCKYFSSSTVHTCILMLNHPQYCGLLLVPEIHCLHSYSFCLCSCLNTKLALFTNIISHNWFNLVSSWGEVL